MGKAKTLSFVLEPPLRVDQKARRVLLARLESARQIYHACLGEARRRLDLVRRSRAYRDALQLPRGSEGRAKAISESWSAQGFSDDDLQMHVLEIRHSWLEAHPEPVALAHGKAEYRLNAGQAEEAWPDGDDLLRAAFERLQAETNGRVVGASASTSLGLKEARLLGFGAQSVAAKAGATVGNRGGRLAEGLDVEGGPWGQETHGKGGAGSSGGTPRLWPWECVSTFPSIPGPGNVDRATLVFDGQCPMCSACAAWVGRRDLTRRIALVPAGPRALAALGIPEASAARSLQLVAADGTRSEGAAAVVQVLARLPRWHWIRHLPRVPGLMALMNFAYRQVARHRPGAR